MKRILVLAAILVFAVAASASFISYGAEDVALVDTEEQLDEVVLDPSIINLRRKDASEDEVVMQSFEEVAADVEATIEKRHDPEMEEHLAALEALEAEVEADNEKESEDAVLLEQNRGYSPQILARVDEALKMNNAAWGIPDMAKAPAKKVFPKIGKGKKTLASEFPLAQVKDELNAAGNRKRTAIDNAEDMLSDSDKFIVAWEKENGGHYCTKPKGTC